MTRQKNYRCGLSLVALGFIVIGSGPRLSAQTSHGPVVEPRPESLPIPSHSAPLGTHSVVPQIPQIPVIPHGSVDLQPIPQTSSGVRRGCDCSQRYGVSPAGRGFETFGWNHGVPLNSWSGPGFAFGQGRTIYFDHGVPYHRSSEWRSPSTGLTLTQERQLGIRHVIEGRVWPIQNASQTIVHPQLPRKNRVLNIPDYVW